MGRSQKVVVDGFCSPEISVDSGVPQGSVIVPILFLIFINDLTQQVKSHCHLFADDRSLYREISCLQDPIALQQELRAGQMPEVYISMPRNATLCPPLNGKTHILISLMAMFYRLEIKTSPYLWVLLSEDLSFSAHIGKESQKASSNLCFIGRNLKGCPERLNPFIPSLFWAIFSFQNMPYFVINQTLIQEIGHKVPVLYQCWPTVVNGGPALKQHWGTHIVVG